MNSSFALIFWNDKILLFHRDDIPTIPHPDHWQLPGGGIEKGESPLYGLKRELGEEVSFVPHNIKFLGKVRRENGITYIFVSFVNDKEAKNFRHGPGEGQEVGFYTIKQALNLQLTPTLRERLISSKNEIEEAMKTKSIPKIKLPQKL